MNTCIHYDYVGVLKSEIQEIQWGVDDVLKNKENAAVILSFNYEDKLIGTIEISVIRDGGGMEDRQHRIPGIYGS